MGRIRELNEVESRVSVSESLVLTTMSIVGLPVEVHVKDGSVFSGIFHTASFQDGYGIALKKVKMVKKGTHNSNVVNGGLVDTLFVRPSDLVQVLAKDFMLPTASGDTTTYNVGAFPGAYNSFQETDSGAVSPGEQLNQQRHDGMNSCKEEDYHHASELIKQLIDVNHSSATVNDGGHTKRTAHKGSQAVVFSNQPTYGSLVANGDTSPNVKVTTQLHGEDTSSDKIGSDAQNHVTNKTAKESKLNPGAKIFSPSLSNFRPNPTHVQAVSTVAYVPNSIQALQIASPQPEVGSRPVEPQTSWPAKVVPYVTSTTTANSGFQYGQHISSHVATRKQPVRHGPVYQQFQAVPSYLHANHQNGMFGRPGQLVYMHPVTHNVIQGSATLSQAPHPLLTSHPIHVTRHEGILTDQAFQGSVIPPLIANGPQTFMMPSHQIQFSQPHFSQTHFSQPHFPSMRPVPYGT